jgi:HEAT repeat protein
MIETLANLHYSCIYEQDKGLEVCLNPSKNWLALPFVVCAWAFSSQSVDAAPVLQYGDSGDAITTLQNQLKQAYCFSQSTRSTGYYGEVTREAVKTLQAQHGLTVDGVAGQQTNAALAAKKTCGASVSDARLKLGDRGQEVELLQIQLTNWGFPLDPKLKLLDSQGKPTGVFDKPTQEALQEFEQYFGLTQDSTFAAQDAQLFWAARGAALASLLTKKNLDLADRGKEALEALGANAVPYFVPLLKSSDPDLCESAAFILGKMGYKAKAAVPDLIELLKSPDNDNCRAAEALGSMGKSAKDVVVPDLITLLEFPNKTVRSTAAYILREIGVNAKAAVPKLIQLLDSPDDRSDAASALGNMGADAKAAVPKLIQLLDSPSDRSYVASALGNMGADAKAAVPKLIQLLDSPSDRSYVASALGNMGADAKAAVPKLIQLLDSPDDRSDVASALGNMGADAKAAVPKLIQLLDSPTGGYDYSSSAALALGNIGIDTEEIVSKLILLVKKDSSVEAMKALARIRPNSEEAIQALVQQLKNSKTNQQAAVTLLTIGAQATPELLKALSPDDQEIRKTVVVASGFMESIDQQLVDKLLKIVSNGREDIKLRQQAAHSLERLNQKKQDVQKFYNKNKLKSFKQESASCPPWGLPRLRYFEPFKGKCTFANREGGSGLDHVKVCTGKGVCK